MYSTDQWLLWSCYSSSCTFLVRRFLVCIIVCHPFIQRCSVSICGSPTFMRAVQNISELILLILFSGSERSHGNVEAGEELFTWTMLWLTPTRAQAFRPSSPVQHPRSRQVWRPTGMEACMQMALCLHSSWGKSSPICRWGVGVGVGKTGLTSPSQNDAARRTLAEVSHEIRGPVTSEQTVGGEPGLRKI